MNSKKSQYILLGIIVLAVLLGIAAYPVLPEKIASHWNAAGEVNGYMSKFWGVFILPMFMIGLYLVRLVVMRVDPLKSNIDSFRKYYEGMWIFISLFFLYIYGLMMAWNFGYQFDFTAAMIPAMALLFYVLGVVMGNTKRNWFMGIRTPWTLSSDYVWDKTHKLAGLLFKIAGAFTLLGLFFRGQIMPIMFLLGPVLIAAFVPLVYSYFVFKQQLTAPK